MPTAREVQEIIARCVSIVVYYQAGDWSGEVADRWTSEIRATALGLGVQGVTPNDARAWIVPPVRLELIERFGASEGARMARTFAEAFDGEDPLGDERPGVARRLPARGLLHGIG